MTRGPTVTHVCERKGLLIRRKGRLHGYVLFGYGRNE